jgi:hypothetical protein
MFPHDCFEECEKLVPSCGCPSLKKRSQKGSQSVLHMKSLNIVKFITCFVPTSLENIEITMHQPFL